MNVQPMIQAICLPFLWACLWTVACGSAPCQDALPSKYDAHATNQGYEVVHANPGWKAEFDGAGWCVRAGDAGWVWGLELGEVGYAGQTPVRTNRNDPAAFGAGIVYELGSGIQEWCINGPSGLEHGYTFSETLRATLRAKPHGEYGKSQCNSQPAQADFEPLILSLRVRGELRGEAYRSGLGIRFLDGNDDCVLQYSGLVVFDALGKVLPARFTVVGEYVQLAIDEREATFPITIDPIVHQAYVKASNTGRDDAFGTSLALEGDTLVVGAPLEDGGSGGVNGPANNQMNRSGAIYIYRRQGDVWSFEAYVKAANPGVFHRFGSSVGVSSDTVVATDTQGGIFVFVRTNGTWSQQARLDHPSPQVSLAPIAISGDRFLVGGAASNRGYVFARSGQSWTLEQMLVSPDIVGQAGWGHSVALDGDRAVLGSTLEASNATGIDGDSANLLAPESGAACVFDRVGGIWTQVAYLKASNAQTGDHFGISVGVSGDRVIVGASQEDSLSTGIGGDESNNAGFNVGAAYVFRDMGGWSQEAYLKADNHFQFSPQFGHSVAIAGEAVLVGAHFEDTNETWLGGPPTTPIGDDSGAAYLFKRIGGAWKQDQYLKAIQSDVQLYYGTCVALTEASAAVTAPGEGSSATGVNGDPTMVGLGAQNSGAAYVMRHDVSVLRYCDPAFVNSSLLAGRIDYQGSLLLSDNSVSLHASSLPLNQFGYFLNSQGFDYRVVPGLFRGALCLGSGAPIGRHNSATEIGFSGATGTIALSLDLTALPGSSGPVVVLSGQTWNFQAWYRDAFMGVTSNFTDAISLRFD